MATEIEFYQRLCEHIPEEAARLIAEELPRESQLGSKIDSLGSRIDALGVRIDGLATKTELERLRSSLFRWQLVFFVPLWAGVYASLVALILKH